MMCVKKKYSGVLALLVALVMIGSTARCQTSLYNTIVKEDSILFNAFNKRVLVTIRKMFAEKLEFYHDRDGLTDYPAVIRSFENMFNNKVDVRRDLVAGSIEVFPIPGYGAVETGTHKFTVVQGGKEMSSLYKFIHTWELKDGEWKITRAISVGH